jgi:hypothetical protein
MFFVLYLFGVVLSSSRVLADQIVCYEELRGDEEVAILIKTPNSSVLSERSSIYLGNKNKPVEERPIFGFSKDENTLVVDDNKMIGTVDFRFLQGAPKEVILKTEAKNLVMVILYKFKEVTSQGVVDVEFVFKNGKRVKSNFLCK